MNATAEPLVLLVEDEDEKLLPFRQLSPSIVPKRNYLAVDLTVSSLYAEEKTNSFMRL
jgi:hypothetical protein